MGFLDFLNKSETIVAIDIGASGVKLIELDLTEEKPRLVHIASGPFSGEIFSGHAISRTDLVSEQLSMLLGTNEITAKLGATAVPGPSVFTKKIKMPKVDPAELSENIHMEASNFIPQNIDAVKLDYHILGESVKNQLDVLVAAVKTEIIESFVDSLTASGIEIAVVDVDYFALQNAFELSYPEHVEKTVALVNIGARYSAVNICRGGKSLFVGDIGVGGKSSTDSIAAELNIASKDAEEKKRNPGSDANLAGVIKKQVENLATELNRQLSFFWNASGAEEGIEQIFLSGGGAMLSGLVDAVAKKTGIKTEILNPFRAIDAEAADPAVIKELGPRMAVAVGLAIRQPGDKIIPEEL